jgi:hypothetical protein
MKTKCVRAGQLERASDKRENAKPVSAKRAKRGYRVNTLIHSHLKWSTPRYVFAPGGGPEC